MPPALDLRASSRSLLWLAGQGRRDDVEALAAELDVLGDDVPTELTRRRAAASPGGARSTCPPTYAASRTSRRGCASGWCAPLATPEGRRVDLFVRIEGVDLAEHPLHVTAEADGVALDVVRGLDHTANRWAGARFQSAAEGAVAVTRPGRGRHDSR